MTVYFIRRILAIIPTFIGITFACFLLINLTPGGPVEQAIHKLRFGAASRGASTPGGQARDLGVNEEILEALKKQYGFDKPVHVRYLIWIKNLMKFDFGNSFTHERPVLTVIKERLPVSALFGVTSFFLSYLVCIPLGLLKAVRDGTRFDYMSSIVIFLMYSIPSFMLGVLLIVYFGGGSYWDLIPIAGLTSDDFENMGLLRKILDITHHFLAPFICYMISEFTTLTMLMKNSIIEEISKDYVRTARAKGLSEKTVITKHALRNALIPLATGLGGFLGIFFAGALFIEVIFSLNGIGLLFFQSILARDYNVVMGLLVIESLIALVGNVISDFIYTVVDPRIDFAKGGM